jgi:hypothetical protein
MSATTRGKALECPHTTGGKECSLFCRTSTTQLFVCVEVSGGAVLDSLLCTTQQSKMMDTRNRTIRRRGIIVLAVGLPGGGVWLCALCYLLCCVLLCVDSLLVILCFLCFGFRLFALSFALLMTTPKQT